MLSGDFSLASQVCFSLAHFKCCVLHKLCLETVGNLGNTVSILTSFIILYLNPLEKRRPQGKSHSNASI